MMRPRPPKAPNESQYEPVLPREVTIFPHPEVLSPNAKLTQFPEQKRQIFRPSRRKDSDRLIKPILSGLGGVNRSNNSSNSQIYQSEYRENSNSPKPNLSRLLQIGGQSYLASLPLENLDRHAKPVDSSWVGSVSRRPQDTLQRITAGIGARNAHSINPVREESQDLRQTKPNSSKNFLTAPGELPDGAKHSPKIVSPRDYQVPGYLGEMGSRRASQQRSELKASGNSILREESIQFDRSRQHSPRSVHPLHDLTGRCFDQIRKAKQLQKEGQRFRDLMRIRGNELVSSIFSKKVSMTSVNESPPSKPKMTKPKIQINWEQDPGLDNPDFDMRSAKSYHFSQAASRKDDFMSKSYDDRSDRNILEGVKRINLDKDLRKHRLQSINLQGSILEPRSNEATKLDLRYHRKSEVKTTSSRTSVQVLENLGEKCDSARLKHVGYELQLAESRSKGRLPNPGFQLSHSKDRKKQQAGEAFLAVPMAAHLEPHEALPLNLQVVVPSQNENSAVGRAAANPSANAQELAEIRAKYRFLE